MQILNMNDYDLVNRRFNGYDLKDEFLLEGIESRFYVRCKQSNDPSVKELKQWTAGEAFRYMSTLLESGL